MPARLPCIAIVILAFVAYARANEPTTQPVNEAKPLVEFSGAHSKVDRPTFRRITNLKEFREAFMQHLGQDSSRFDEFYNPFGVPTVDFNRCMVIAVFAGSGWNDAGISAVSISDDRDRLLVRFAHRYYQTSVDFNSQNDGGERVTAFGIFVLPRSDKEVVLQEGSNRYGVSPQEWKEVARFPSTLLK
jgi:hypothetical protein